MQSATLSEGAAFDAKESLQRDCSDIVTAFQRSQTVSSLVYLRQPFSSAGLHKSGSDETGSVRRRHLQQQACVDHCTTVSGGPVAPAAVVGAPTAVLIGAAAVVLEEKNTMTRAATANSSLAGMAGECRGVERMSSFATRHTTQPLQEARRCHSESEVDDPSAPNGSIAQGSASSSNSSLSQSPSPSLETVAGSCQLAGDSDVDAETDLPDWQAALTAEELAALSSRERKRQDTINELFHTEQTHVRLLKIMYHLFYNPMSRNKLLSQQHLKLLFPNLETMLKIHSNFNAAMKKRRKEQPFVTDVGDILTEVFEGRSGEQFQHEASVFVRSQSIGLEGLKLSKKRDQKLCGFLQDQENDPVCKRLQLKDMLPASFQRLTKYPLLLESLLSYTPAVDHPVEHSTIQRCLDRSRDILATVNTAIMEEDNNQKLLEIQKRLDQSSMCKNKHAPTEDLKGNLDLTKHRLVFDGTLSWKVSNTKKHLEMYVLILEDFIVFLQKDNDKYVLKNHYNTPKATGFGKEEKVLHYPIIYFGRTFLIRKDASLTQLTLYLVTTQQSPTTIYEVVTANLNDKQMWFRHFNETANAYEAKHDPAGRRSTSRHDDPQHDDVVDDEEDEADTTVDTSTSAALSAPSEPAPLAPTPTADADTKAGEVSPATLELAVKARRLREVQVIQIVEETPLISPAEVTVTSAGSLVLQAEPVVTPLEHLRRKDASIKRALEEKQHIIADILGIPREDYETLADMASEPSNGPKEPRELVLGALYQAQALQGALNDALTVSEGAIVAARAGGPPQPPAPLGRLVGMVDNLNTQLTSLLSLVAERDDERERMRRELAKSHDRIHQLAATQPQTEPAVTPDTLQCATATTHQVHEATAATVEATVPVTPRSRPVSLLSQGSDASETHTSESCLPHTEATSVLQEPPGPDLT